MLRVALLVVTGIVFVAGLLAWASGHPGGVPAAWWGGILLIAVLVERWRYRQASDDPGANWVATDERFVDPETGRTTQVWYDPRTGARSYRDA